MTATKTMQIYNTYISPATTSLMDVGSSSLKWKDGWFSGLVTVGTLSGNIIAASITAGTGSFTGNLFVGGFASIGGAIIGGTSVTVGTASFAGNLFVGGTASVGGAIIGGTSLTVGTASIAGNLITGGTASVAGAIIGGTSLTVGTASIAGNLITGGTASIAGAIIGGTTLTIGTVSATGNLISGGTTSVAGAIIGGTTITVGTVSATGNIIGGGTLTVASGTVTTLLTVGTVSASGNVICAGTTSAANFISSVASGTPPYATTSTTLNTNLNADLLDNQQGSYYLDSTNFTGANWVDLTDGGATTLHSHAGGGIPTAITVADEAADTTCFPIFVTAATGDLGPKTNAGLKFNSSTGQFESTIVSAATGFVPDANDGAYIGTTALQFSDLFLAEGGVINWDNGDITLTQTGNYLYLQGGVLGIGVTDPDSALEIDSSAAAQVVLHLKGAASQSGDYLQITDSADAIIHKTTSAGITYLFDTDASYAAAIYAFIMDNTITFTADYSALTFINLTATVVMDQATALVSTNCFNFAPTIKNPPATERNLGIAIGFIAQPVIQADTQTITAAQVWDFLASGTTNRINGGTLTLPAWMGFYSYLATIDTGSTVTAAYHFRAEDVSTKNGALTTQYGLYVGALAKGTTNYSILTNTGLVVLNENGSDSDIRFEGDNDANLFFCDASTDRIGIGKNNPGTKLDVTGTITATGITCTGVIDLGGADSFEIPNAANPTCDATGEIAFDTTDNTLIIYDGTAERVIGHDIYQANFTIYSDGTWTDDAVPIWQAPKDMAVTIVQINCTCVGGTNITYNIEERAWGSLASAGTDIYTTDEVADTNGEEETSFANAGIAAKAHLVFVPSAVSGVVSAVTGVIYYRKDVE